MPYRTVIIRDKDGLPERLEVYAVFPPEDKDDVTPIGEVHAHPLPATPDDVWNPITSCYEPAS